MNENMPSEDAPIEIDAGVLQLTVSLSHPECWTLRETTRRDVTLLGRGLTRCSRDLVTGIFTATGHSETDLHDLGQSIAGNPHVDDVTVLPSSIRDVGFRTGLCTREFLVQYHSDVSITSALASKGFFVDRPVRIANGREEWNMYTCHDRSTIQEKLAEIRRSESADIDIKHIVSDNSSRSKASPQAVLTPRQHEVFMLARDLGYYTYPKESTTAELAAELEITESTVLEHLHKAEAKLLDRSTASRG